ncbi:MAG: MFS transporter [Bacteroidales bacterium]|nr:MFS transporter [Bacteroidales bacterium]
MSSNTATGNRNLVPIITMMFLFAMISFVTNMAAPFGNIWGNQYPWSGMLGNLMNFAAYLFMGIPAGKMLARVGYKKTALYALILGFVGLGVQYLSSIIGTGTAVFHTVVDNTDYLGVTTEETVAVTLNLFIYLLGAFICGFCVCMLNTVVNPMLNILGGGGKKGNQLLQTGSSLNSLAGTLTPMLVGALIGSVTPKTSMSDVAPLLFIGMGIFAISYFVISLAKIPEPALERAKADKAAGKAPMKFEHSPWKFRHFVLGAIGIFFYVGIEIGIPAELNFYLSDASDKGAGLIVNGAAIGGAIVAVYWLLMLVGRVASGFISGLISTRIQLLTVSGLGSILILIAIMIPKESRLDVPTFIYNPESKTETILKNIGVGESDIASFKAAPEAFVWSENYDNPDTEEVEDINLRAALYDEAKVKVEDAPKMLNTPSIPLSAIFLILCGLCTSLMWGGIFNLAVEGLGKYTEQASGIFMMLVVGGGIMPLIQHNIIASALGYMASYWLVIAMLLYLFYYAVVGCKNVNKDIPVD